LPAETGIEAPSHPRPAVGAESARRPLGKRSLFVGGAALVRAAAGRLAGGDRWSLVALSACAAQGIAALIWKPRVVDLAAHEFRAWLFGSEGFAIWNGQWYGGHHAPAYSILSPLLGWALGVRTALALAALASAALLAALLRLRYPPSVSRLGVLWAGVGCGTLIWTGRLPFAIGTALALASLYAFARRRPGLALALGVLAPLGSPVAGLFLTMAACAIAIAHRNERRTREWALALAAASFLPPVFLSFAFPEGGWAPFPTTAYLPIPLFALACLAVLPRRDASLRWGAVLYALGSTLALFIDTPMGGNAVRLGALVGGPLLVCAAAERGLLRLRPLAVPAAAGLALLAVWQWSPAVRDVRKYLEDPAARSDYFEPLRQYLATLPDQRRIEIPFTRSHWESAEIAPLVPLARGWLRQLDTGRNPIFYRGPLNELTYASWLSENAVRYVALPSAKPDRSSYGERALIERGLPYLKLRWRSRDWRVYEVMLPAPFVIPRGRAAASLERLETDQVLLRVVRPGDFVVRVRWTPYWYLPGGCVYPDEGWTGVRVRRSGFARLVIRFAPERLFARGRRCDDG